jgi:threonine dehydrogenase-like Zn-dependent dehydrogenase
MQPVTQCRPTVNQPRLWPYGSRPATEHGDRIGHEFLGVVEDVGSQVSGLKTGEVVLVPFVWSDNTCDFCTEGLQTSCRHGGLWARDGIDGGQGEAVRVPQAQGTLVKLPAGEDCALLASLLTLSDVFPTGHHCAVTAGVNPRIRPQPARDIHSKDRPAAARGIGTADTAVRKRSISSRPHR